MRESGDLDARLESVCNKRFRAGAYDRPPGHPSREAWERALQKEEEEYEEFAGMYESYYGGRPPEPDFQRKPPPSLAVAAFEYEWIRKNEPELLWHCKYRPLPPSLPSVVVPYFLALLVLGSICAALVSWIVSLQSEPWSLWITLIMVAGVAGAVAFAVGWSEQRRERRRYDSEVLRELKADSLSCSRAQGTSEPRIDSRDEDRLERQAGA